MNVLLNPPQWPFEAWIGVAIVALIIGILISNAVKAGAAKTGTTAKAAEASLVAHVKSAVAKHPHVPAPDPAIVQAVSAAPAVDAKASPPVGASSPSAGSGGPALTDRVAATHAALEAEIASHTAAIETALAKKQALETAQQRLTQLTGGV